MLAHARSFFPDIVPATEFDITLRDELQGREKSFHDYVCYLLLDFSRVDRDLEDVPLAYLLTCSEKLNLQDRFEQLIVKELGISKRN